MNAADAVIYARQLATSFREEGHQHAAIGNDLQAEVRRMSAIVLEGFAYRLEREIAEGRIAA